MNVGSFASFVVTCNRGESMHTSSEEPMGLHALPEDTEKTIQVYFMNQVFLPEIKHGLEPGPPSVMSLLLRY